MTPEVSTAVEQLRELFSASRIDVLPESDGGARVTVHDLDIGNSFCPRLTWCGFVIPFQYPRADVYPHFIDLAVKRTDGQPLGMVAACGFGQQSRHSTPGDLTMEPGESRPRLKRQRS